MVSMRTVTQVAVGVVIFAGMLRPAWGGAAPVLTCADGVANSLAIAGRIPSGLGAIACDADATPDGSCTFLSACPPCSLSEPQCLAPCFNDPSYTLATVPTGSRQFLNLGRSTLIVRCKSIRVRPHR
jgi:hypothetical protein